MMLIVVFQRLKFSVFRKGVLILDDTNIFYEPPLMSELVDHDQASQVRVLVGKRTLE